MPVFAPIKQDKESKVHNSQYIRTENAPDNGDAQPAEPAAPEVPEAT